MTPEDLYRKLQKHLDRMPVGFPSTQSGVEIRILRDLFSPEEAEVALALSAIPEPANVIHKRLGSGLTLNELSEILTRMEQKGVILGIPAGGEMRFSKLVYAVGMFERQLPRLTPEFARDSEQYMAEAFGKAFHTKRTTQMRTVPINKSIAHERNVGRYEDIRAYVEASDGPFAAALCICRHGADLIGRPCKQTNLRENCLTLGKAAEWMVGHGMARFITRERMLELLDEADHEGLVLQPENTKDPLFVCCCCGCCCGVLRSAKAFPEPAVYFSSNYYADVDASACQSCGTCETRCQMDAIRADSGPAAVDRSRCIGCALCVTTCPSDAMRLVKKEAERIPPDDTRALYMRILQERYGPWGMAKIAARKMMGMKI